MLISRQALKLAIMFVIGFGSAAANASSSCNMRDGKGRYAASNPERKVAKSGKVQNQSKATMKKSYKGKK